MDLDDNNSTVTAQEDNSQLQINEIDESFDNQLSVSDDDELSSDSEIEIRDKDSGKTAVTVSPGQSVTIQGNAPYDYYYSLQKSATSDFTQKEFVVNYLNLGSSEWHDAYTDTFSQSDDGKTFYYRFYMTNGRHGTYSNILAYTVGNGANSTVDENGTAPVYNSTATLRIYDAGYPNNSTVFSDGDYAAVLMYDLVKSGDGFKDEAFTVVITDEDGHSKSYDMGLNSQSTLGSLTITEDNVYKFVVVYTATLNGEEYSVESNVLTYVTKNTSNVSDPSGNETNGSSSASLRIYDAGYPNNSTVFSDGDYAAVLMYDLVKSGDGFKDEAFTVVITDEDGHSKSYDMGLNSQSTLGSLTITEDNVYKFVVVYTATLNGKEYSTKSNVLTYITKNTSNISDENKSDNNTQKNETILNINETSDVQIIIRDANVPENSTIAVGQNYTPVLEYYVVVPSGDLIISEIIIMCDGEGIATITKDSLVANKYTKVTTNKILNETGTHVFSAQYKYYVFIGAGDDINSNIITYNVNINSISPAENKTNGTVPSKNDTNETNPVQNETNGTAPVHNETVPDENKTVVSLVIRDANYPSDSVIVLNEEYAPVVEFYVVKPSGDFVSDEIVIMCNGKGVKTVESPSDKTYTSVTLDSLNETGTYVFTAQYKYFIFMGLGEDIDSNSVTYNVTIANSTVENKTNGTGPSQNDTNGTTPVHNETGPDENKTVVSLVIRDANYPSDSVIVLNEEYAPVVEFYVVKPSGDFVSDEIVIMCNGKGVKTVSSPADKNYTSVTLDSLNETGIYVFTAQYKYFIFMGLGEDIDSNSVTYNVTIANSAVENKTNGTSPFKNETNTTNPENNSVTTVINVVGVNSNNLIKAVLTDISGKPVGDAKVKCIVDGKSVDEITDSNGMISVQADKNSTVDIVFEGDDKLAPCNVTFVFEYVGPKEENQSQITNKSQKTSVIAVTKVDGGNYIEAVLKDSEGNVIANETIEYAVNGVNGSAVTDSSGIFIIKAKDNSKVDMFFKGNDDVSASNTSIELKAKLDFAVATKFNVTNGYSFEVYAVDYRAGERGYLFNVFLSDVKRNSLAGQLVQFGIQGNVHNKTTDKKGVATLQINLMAANEYTCTPCYLGNDSYRATFAATKIVVVKKPITINAGAKTFKSSAKTKKYTVSLKTIAGSSADGKVYLSAGKKVTLKINGKTYSAKINAQGKATFSIKLTKKGKFTSVISFAGDKTYDGATKKVKITIR